MYSMVFRIDLQSSAAKQIPSALLRKRIGQDRPVVFGNGKISGTPGVFVLGQHRDARAAAYFCSQAEIRREVELQGGQGFVYGEGFNNQSLLEYIKYQVDKFDPEVNFNPVLLAPVHVPLSTLILNQGGIHWYRYAAWVMDHSVDSLIYGDNAPPGFVVTTQRHNFLIDGNHRALGRLLSQSDSFWAQLIHLPRGAINFEAILIGQRDHVASVLGGTDIASLGYGLLADLEKASK